MTIRRCLLLALLAAGILAVALGSLGARAAAATRGSCEDPFRGVRDEAVSFLLATPRPDTVPDPSLMEGRFGQRADALLAGGAAADRIGAAVDDDPSVVLLPWGFDEDCRPIPWTGSWRWARPDVEGFYRGRLRATDAWIEDRPTFDVELAVWEGFPGSPWPHSMSTGRQELSARELFDLYALLPTARAMESRPYGAVSDLVEWRRAAGPRAEFYPAATMLRSAFRLAEVARLRSTSLPFAGVYRLRIQRGADTLGSFFMQTGTTASDPYRTPEPHGGVPTAPVPAIAYAAPAALAGSTGGLAAIVADPEESSCVRPRGLRAEVEERDSDAAREWRAELPASFLAACFGEASPLGALSAAAAVDGLDSATDSIPGFQGRFRHESDGTYTFRQPITLANGEDADLVGERIAPDGFSADEPLEP